MPAGSKSFQRYHAYSWSRTYCFWPSLLQAAVPVCGPADPLLLPPQAVSRQLSTINPLRSDNIVMAGRVDNPLSLIAGLCLFLLYPILLTVPETLYLKCLILQAL